MKITTEQLSYHEVMAYFKYNTEESQRHCSAIRGVIRPLRVYKKTEDTIVSLEIPVGALVHFNDSITESQFNGGMDYRKMRASKARVVQQITFLDNIPAAGAWSMDRVKTFTLYGARDVTESRSEYSSRFVYKTGEIVVPVNGFYEQRGTCEAGIHFYVNLSDALKH